MNVPRTPSPGEECCICLERIEKKDSQIWGCENCGNRYHVGCIQDWLNTKDSNSKCPTCRENIECMSITISISARTIINTRSRNIVIIMIIINIIIVISIRINIMHYYYYHYHYVCYYTYS